MFSTYRVSSRLSRYLSCSKSARLISPQIHSISSSQENRKFSVVSRTGFSPVTNNSFITTCCKMSSSNQPQFSANFLFRQVKFELFFMSMIDENKLIFLRTDLKYACLKMMCLDVFHACLCSDVGRWKNGGGAVVIGGHNLSSLDWSRVNWSAKYWGAPLAPSRFWHYCLGTHTYISAVRAGGTDSAAPVEDLKIWWCTK